MLAEERAYYAAATAENSVLAGTWKFGLQGVLSNPNGT
jgi:hypothetical protein